MWIRHAQVLLGDIQILVVGIDLFIKVLWVIKAEIIVLFWCVIDCANNYLTHGRRWSHTFSNDIYT